MTNRTACVVAGCEKPSGTTQGWCEMHRARMRRHGTLEPSQFSHGPVEDRFWRWVDKSGDCWEWTGAKAPGGYGVIQVSRAPKRQTHASRVAWEMENGPIPAGMLVCHHCDNPPCVRVDHLFLGTQADNIADMVGKGRHAYAAECASGHPWTPESTRYIMVKGRPARRCVTCRRQRDGSVPVGATHCQMCARELGPPPHKGHPRKYCDRQCREAFYKVARPVTHGA